MWRNLGTSFHSGIKTNIKAVEACEFITTKKFRAIASAGRVMASVFWDKRGVFHVDFLPRCGTINSDYYCRVLSDVHTRLRKKTAWFDHSGRSISPGQRTSLYCTPHYVHITATRLGGIATSPLQPGPRSEWFPPVWTPKGVPRRSAFQHWWGSEAGCRGMVQPYWRIFLCRGFPGIS